MKTIAECSCKFAIDCLKRRSKDNSEKNMILSPICMELALVSLYVGCRGTTADQLRQVLHFPSTETETSTDVPFLGSPCGKSDGVYNHWKKVMSAIIQHSESYQLKIAHRQFVSKTFEVLQSYKRCLKELCNSESESVDFMNATEKVRKQMNSWFESQTNGAISNVFPANSIQPSSLMVSASALYFKGIWNSQFNPMETHIAAFWIAKDQSIYVEMMTQLGNFNIVTITNPSMKVLELPHENGDTSSYFFIPDGHVIIDEIITNLSYEKLQEWISPENMRNIPAKVYVPKLKLTDDYSMKPDLISMGVTDLFMPERADLSGISGRRGLSVTEMRFKTCFEMSEEGAVAAGASRAEIGHGNYSKVKCNRPFIIIVIHKPVPVILCTVTICKPE